MPVAARLVRRARAASGLSQRELARLAGVAQSSVARVEADRRDPGSELLDRLVTAAGWRMVTIPTRSPTVSELADQVAARVRVDRTAEAFRLLIQLCDVLRSEPLLTRGPLCIDPPSPTGDHRYDAFIAAAVEHFLVAGGLPVPAWTAHPDRFVSPLWFVAGIPGLQADAYLTAPASFFRRGVMINGSELASA